MKTSNRYLLLFLFVCLAAASSLSFYLQPHFTPMEEYKKRTYLKGEGALRKDTLFGEYTYIWSDFEGVELDPTRTGYTEITAFENVKDEITLDIRNDTLFISQNSLTGDTKFSYDWKERPIHIVAAARNLKGIEAVGWGHFTNFTEGSDAVESPTGEIIYPQTASLPVNCAAFDIHLRKGGSASLEVIAGTINVSVIGQPDYATASSFTLAGSCRKLTVLHRDDYFTVMASKMQADSVFIDSQTPFSAEDGLISVYANEYLNAHISGWSNVVYLGKPTVVKKEIHSGRVIDNNYYGLQ